MKSHWITRPANIRRLWMVFIAVLLATVTAGGLVHGHAYFTVDGTFAFNAWYGFATCVGMVLIAKGLAVVLKRNDTYYDVD